MMVQPKSEEVFQLKSPFQDPLRNTLFTAMRRPISKFLKLGLLNDIYQRSTTGGQGGEVAPFLDSALRNLNVEVCLSQEDRERLPSEGPAVVVANHPFGVVEGMILSLLLRRARPDAKIMANYLLSYIPEMRDMLFMVDPFGRDASARKNIGPLKDCIRFVKNGGMIGVFPAGEVASVKLSKRMVADPAWSPTVARIVKISGAKVIPVFFEGGNGALFHLMGLIHPRLRTAMLPRCNLRTKERRIHCAVGSPIPHEKLAKFRTDDEVIQYMRFRTYLLKHRLEKPGAAPGPVRPRFTTALAKPRSKSSLGAEVKALPKSGLLVETDEFMVFETPGNATPNLIHEICRMRERLFREVGEGTGLALDKDRFDAYYRHLVLWDKTEECIAGAYRIGLADEILEAHGPKGLYTSTLFTFRREFFDKLSPAMELGRAFIETRYQKSYGALMLLWKGISEVVLREGRYRYLFGPVSISAEYRPVSREIMLAVLKRHHFDEDAARWVKAKTPPKLSDVKRLDLEVPHSAFADPRDAGLLVGEVEPGKGVPILLKHYLKLGSKMLAFNVDNDFGGCVDGLIMVDLLKTDPKVMVRYMGKERYAEFKEGLLR
jgi:putative hemolysin